MHNSELRMHRNCALDNPCLFVLHMGYNNQCMFNSSYVYKNDKTNCETYSYIQIVALNLTEILKITIYSTKHIQNTKTKSGFAFTKHLYCSKLDIRNINVLCRCLWHHQYFLYINNLCTFVYA